MKSDICNLENADSRSQKVVVRLLHLLVVKGRLTAKIDLYELAPWHQSARRHAGPGRRMLTWTTLRARTAGVLCGLSFCFILIAGLWPFGHPRNDVTWIANQNGVHFGKRGTILSSGPLVPRNIGSCSIEMWLRPTLSDRWGTLLGFYDRSGLVGLSLHQSLTDLRLDREVSRGRPAKIYVDDVFTGGTLVFLTVVTGPGGTAVYRDGSLARQASGFRSSSPCSGSFVVGDSPRVNDSWQGEIAGLAIYGDALTAGQASLNYQSWRSTGRPAESGTGTLAALYLFDERDGRLIRDHHESGVNLSIPERYTIVQEMLYESPWSAFEPTGGWIKDIIINVVGFIPFGFTLSALLWCSGWKRSGTTAVLGGLFVSLVIEGLQSYLPTRDSDLTDVLTNTLGTLLGVILRRQWIRWVGIAPRREIPRSPWDTIRQ
jgi:VanZ family protein